MARFHGKVLDAGRLATLALALSAPMAAADPFEPAPDVLGPDIRQSLEHHLDRIALEAIGTHADQALDTARPVNVDDPSNVYLLVHYSDGSTISGSGTITAPDHPRPGGLARVLTAAHVVTPELSDGSRMTEIVAFAPDGRTLATLQPVLIGSDETGLDNDLAVLQPTTFADSATARDWNAHAARIASVQPTELMMLSAGASDPILNGGLSGSSLRNGAGEIVGIAFYAFHAADDRHLSHTGIYLGNLDRTLAAVEDPFGQSGPISNMAQNAAETEFLGGGVGLALPIVQRDVLDALGIDAVSARASGAPFLSRVTGYPRSELHSSELVTSPLIHHRVETRMETEMVSLPDRARQGSMPEFSAYPTM